MKLNVSFRHSRLVFAALFVLSTHAPLHAEQPDFRAKTWSRSGLQEFFMMGTQENIHKAMGAPDIKTSGAWIYRGLKITGDDGTLEIVSVALHWSEADGRSVVGSVEIRGQDK